LRIAGTLALLLLTSFVLGVMTETHAQGLRAGNPEEVGMSSERLARIEPVIQEAIAAEKTPGAVVLVARKGVVVYRKAFGMRATKPTPEAMTLDSVFDVASLTKAMATATSLMILVEEGKFSLREKVSDFLPKFGQRGKASLTFRQLATHFSGLRPDLDLDTPWKGHDHAVELAFRERLVAEPDEKFIYSDIGYLVLGEAIGKVSGEPLEEFSRKHVFEPLGMKDTGFKPGPDLTSRIVPTESRNGVLLRGVVHDPTAERMGGVAGHAGLFSTADDCARWAQMLLNGGVFEQVRILSPMSVLAMTTPQSPAGNFDWRGLGFDVETRFSTVRGDLFPVGSYGHTGFTGTAVWIDPYSQTIVILFTSRLHPEGKGDVVPLRARVASVVAASILDFPLTREPYFRQAK